MAHSTERLCSWTAKCSVPATLLLSQAFDQESWAVADRTLCSCWLACSLTKDWPTCQCLKRLANPPVFGFVSLYSHRDWLSALTFLVAADLLACGLLSCLPYFGCSQSYLHLAAEDEWTGCSCFECLNCWQPVLLVLSVKEDWALGSESQQSSARASS